MIFTNCAARFAGVAALCELYHIIQIGKAAQTALLTEEHRRMNGIFVFHQFRVGDTVDAHKV